MERMQHENWGYLDMVARREVVSDGIVAWNKKRYGINVNPESVVITTGVHPGIIAALRTFCLRAAKCC
jgi:bifunctional pyridoxal-dependent enzyme with beta-cystathionase and maltose regulon repressor activities